MASRRTKPRTLTIFPIKDGVSPADALPDREDLTRIPVRHGSRSLGTLYVRTPRSAAPRWLSLFSGYADLNSFRLRNASTAAVFSPAPAPTYR